MFNIFKPNAHVKLETLWEHIGDFAKMLKLPATAPTEQKLVTIGTDNKQVDLKIGDNLEVDDGTLECRASVVTVNPTLVGTEATMNGIEVDGVKYKAGGGESQHLYKHDIYIHSSYGGFTFNVSVSIINNNNTQFTYASLRTYLGDNGYDSQYSDDKKYPSSGILQYGGGKYATYGLFAGGMQIYTYTTHTTLVQNIDSDASVIDTITNLV